MAPAQTVGDLVCLVRLGLPWVPVAGSTVGLVTAVCSKLVIYVIYVCMPLAPLAASLSFWYTKSYWLGAKCSQMQREKEEGKTSRSALFAAINRVKTAPTKKENQIVQRARFLCCCCAFHF